jgi:hypothetical protein
VLDPSLHSLRDSIIAIKLLPEEHHRDIEGLTRALRDLEVIRKTAEDNRFPRRGRFLGRYRHRSLKLPFALDLPLTLNTTEYRRHLDERRRESEERRRRQAEERLATYERVEAECRSDKT